MFLTKYPLAFPLLSFLSDRSFTRKPSLMVSFSRPAVTLCGKLFRRVATAALSARSSSADLEQLKHRCAAQAKQWSEFGERLPKDLDIPFFASVAQDLAAAYRADAESKPDATCWALDMAKWDSAAEDPLFQQYQHTNKHVKELLNGVFSRIDHCRRQGILADAVKFWNTIAKKRLEDAMQAKVQLDKVAKQALTEKAKEAEAEAEKAEREEVLGKLVRIAPLLLLVFVLGYLGFPAEVRIRLLQKHGFLSQQVARLAIMVENNNSVPSVLTNFRGCRKSTVCELYAKHSWLIGHTCVYISNDPDKPNANNQWLVDTGKVVCGAVSALLGGLMYAPWKWPYKRVFTKSIYVSVPVSLALGFIAPMLVNRGVVIFDDITLDSLFAPKDGAAKNAPYTDIPFVVNAGYNGRSYRGWIQVVVSSNEGIRLLQRDSAETKYGYAPFPMPSAEELRSAVEDYISQEMKRREKDALDKGEALHPSDLWARENFPSPTVDEIKLAVRRYGEWWGRSIRFWILPFTNNNAGFYKRMRSAELTADEIGKLAAELDLKCSSGPAPLIGSPPIDVSKFNEAFAFIKGKGPARGRSARLVRQQQGR